jgi:hypothetical protein
MTPKPIPLTPDSAALHPGLYSALQRIRELQRNRTGCNAIGKMAKSYQPTASFACRNKPRGVRESFGLGITKNTFEVPPS